MAPKKKNKLISVIEKLDASERMDVLQFAKMLLNCQKLKLTPIDPDDWNAMPVGAKYCVSEMLEFAANAAVSYKSILLNQPKNSRLLRSG